MALMPIDMKSAQGHPWTVTETTASTRRYVMRARADAVGETRRSIIRAAIALVEERASLEFTLHDLAAEAGVSVQTALRHFGSRDAIVAAATELMQAEVVEERRAPAGDVRASVATIVAHYERRGDFVVRMLGREHHDERVRSLMEPGKQLHRAWVEECFAPQVDHLSHAARDDVTDLLVVATDVYTWHLLRRGRGLSRVRCEAQMLALVEAVLGACARPAPHRSERRSS